MRTEIEVTFDDDGNPVFHVQGVKGKGCVKLLDELAKEIGGKAGDVRHTAEYYAEPAKAGGKVSR